MGQTDVCRHAEMKMNVSHRKNAWIGGSIVVVVVLVGLLITFVGSWWHSATSPVELFLDAPKGTEIHLHWQEGESPLRLVPIDQAVDGWHRLWSTELPPRPTYQLALEFTEIPSTLLFRELKVLQLAPSYIQVGGVTARERSRWSSEGIHLESIEGDAVALHPGSGGIIRLMEAVDRRPENYLETFFIPAFSLLVLALLGAGLIGSGLWFPLSLDGPGVMVGWSRRANAGGILVFLMAAALHWHFVTTSLPDFWPADSTSYADKAVALAFGGTYDTGQYEYELNRLPGYPLLAAAALRWIEPGINAIVKLQTAVALVCFGFLFWQLRPFIRWWALLVGMPLVLLSPPLLWACRQIATESLFVGLWFLTTGAAVWSWRRPVGKRTVPWSFFIVSVTAASMVRTNGILLLTLPGCALIGELVRCYLGAPGRWQMLKPQGARLGFVVLPFAIVLVVLAAWSVRNHYSRGYLAPSDLGPVVGTNAPFNTGTLDIRVFENGDIYDWAVQERRAQGYFFHGWNVRNYQFMRIYEADGGFDQTTVSQLASAQKQFAEANSALIPWQAKWVARWRVLGWGLWVPEWGAYTRDSLRTSYKLPIDFNGPVAERTLQQRFDWLARPRAEGQPYPRLSVEKGTPSWLKNLYNTFVPPAYPVIYRLLVFSGVVLLLVSVWRRDYLPVVLLMPFFVNVVLNIYLLYVVGRYVQVLDGMLILGILASVPAFRNDHLRRLRISCERAAS